MNTDASIIDVQCTRNFITQETQVELRGIALRYHKNGILESNPRGPHRYRAKIWGTRYCTDPIKKIGSKIVKHFNLAECPIDPQLGWIISLIENGGQIHPHRDRYSYHDDFNAKHLRCNIMVSKENCSGDPIIESETISIPERAMWSFFPSESTHATHVIDMLKPRIVFQFGFMVPNDYRLPEKQFA